MRNACYSATLKLQLKLMRALQIAQPAVAFTMPPQLWFPLPLLLLCASLVATPIGAEAAGGAMMPNNGDRFGNINIAHVQWRTMRTSVESFGACSSSSSASSSSASNHILQAL